MSRRIVIFHGNAHSCIDGIERDIDIQTFQHNLLPWFVAIMVSESEIWVIFCTLIKLIRCKNDTSINRELIHSMVQICKILVQPVGQEKACRHREYAEEKFQDIG
jgi:hypothetical protein